MNPLSRHGIVLLSFWAMPIFSQSLLDAGFENYEVTSGSYVRPTEGPWSFANDAVIVAPLSPNTSLGPLETWSATLPAYEGSLYASTYAGQDSIAQSVHFAEPGLYQISVFAASPSGTLTIPGVLDGPVVDGEFTFLLDSSKIGNPFSVEAGAGWTQFSTSFNVASAGDYHVGVLNTATARYFVNYDAFSIEVIPEPSTTFLVSVGLILALLSRLVSGATTLRTD